MSQPRLIRLCYVSEANLPEGDEAQHIEAILVRSHWWNPQVGITGALLFNRVLFAQALEGPVGAVEALFERIRSDPRHMRAIRVDWREIPARDFGDWSMAFIGEDGADRERFAPMMPSPAQLQRMASDGMLDLLVRTVRGRERGLAGTKAAEESAAFSASSRASNAG